MSKKNEDSIERFFRKAVAQHDTAFRESDWVKMEKLLEQKEAEKAAIRSANLRRAAYSLIGLAIITASIVYVLISEGNASLSTKEVLPEQMQAAAGDEAPRMDKAKEDPAAGLHSSPSKQIHNDDKVTSRQEAATSKAQKKEDAVFDKSQTPSQSLSKKNPMTRPELQAGDNKGGSKVDENSGMNEQNPAHKGADAVRVKPEVRRSAALADQSADVSEDQKNAAVKQRTTTQSPDVSANQPAGNDQVSSNNQSSSGKTSLHQRSNEAQQRTGAELNSARQPGQVEPPVITEHKIPAAIEGVSATKDPESDQPHLKKTETSNKGSNSTAPLVADVPVPGTQGHQPQRSNTLEKEAGALLTEQQPEQALVQKRANKDSTGVETPVDKVDSSPEDLQPVPTRWNVALMLAPDFSTTGLERYTAPGEAYGIAIGYQFLSRFTVSTGLVKSTKKYVGYGSDYQPPAGYWRNRTNGIIPDDITGKCGIVEIPLMIQFTLKQREKSRIYLAAGVSSYVMMHESYEYSFETPNPGAAKGWSTSESSTYPFAIGHLSAAYERQLSHRWAIGLEPFLKIPFAGVGWSDVNLYSTGAFINLRYRFFRKQQFAVSETRKTTQQ